MIQVSVQLTPLSTTRFLDVNIDDHLLHFTAQWVQLNTSGPLPSVQVQKFEGITLTNSLRFLADQSTLCRDRDAHEALCLLVPSLMRVLQLTPMNGYESDNFRKQFREALQFHSLSELKQNAAA
jgi:hypothetical protein